ncbi:MAG: hypothetical protein QOK39_44 [Acidimicrobiaceae bacterium]|nr:hypothetical protein [Acidimicrobiaceae bacterium]
MRHGRRVETRRDRRALATDAGMGRVSALSVLAGALCGLAVFEILTAIAGSITVAIHGGTDFSSVSAGQFKTLVGVVATVAVFLAFIFGGYVSGRMSRRSGATHGVLAGIAGVILAALTVAAVRASGADNGVARVATHIQVANSWHDWRTFALFGVLVGAAAMIIGALVGGIQGESWHGKLLTRAVDPTYGRAADDRAEARKRLNDAEAARLAAAGNVGRVTAAERAARQDTAVNEPVEPVGPQGPAPTRTATTTGPTAAVVSRSTRRGPAMPGAETAPVAPEPTAPGSTAEETGRRHRHLLGRR